jgi:excisionase family DNA binding protein
MEIRRSFEDYPPVMDSADVAELLGLSSIKQIQQMVREGRLPARRLPGSRHYRFLRDELVAWLRSDATAVRSKETRGTD